MFFETLPQKLAEGTLPGKLGNMFVKKQLFQVLKHIFVTFRFHQVNTLPELT